MLTYYPTDSFLHRCNPVIKLIMVIVLVVLVTFAYDVATPAIYLALVLLTLRFAGNRYSCVW
jgi:energy-coupling factor transporter transmembrane protein EcfT